MYIQDPLISQLLLLLPKMRVWSLNLSRLVGEGVTLACRDHALKHPVTALRR